MWTLSGFWLQIRSCLVLWTEWSFMIREYIVYKQEPHSFFHFYFYLMHFYLCQEIRMMFWYRFGLYAWHIVGSTIKCKLILCWLKRVLEWEFLLKTSHILMKFHYIFSLKLMFQGFGDCRLKQVACHLLNVFSVMATSSRCFKVWCPYVRWLWNKKALGQCVWGPYHVLCLFCYLKQNILKTLDRKQVQFT